MTSSYDFHAFHRFADLQSQGFFSENSLWSNILNHLKTKVTPKNPHSCCSLQQCIYAFLQSHYGLLHYFEMSSSFSSNNTLSSKNYEIQFFSHFVEFTVEQVLKSCSNINNSLEAHVFGFSNSLPHGLEESRK